jgi:3-hydroxyacyl-CoA dehydrogenase
LLDGFDDLDYVVEAVVGGPVRETELFRRRDRFGGTRHPRVEHLVHLDHRAGYGDSKYRACPMLRHMVAAGELARKTERGLYAY